MGMRGYMALTNIYIYTYILGIWICMWHWWSARCYGNLRSTGEINLYPLQLLYRQVIPVLRHQSPSICWQSFHFKHNLNPTSRRKCEIGVQALVFSPMKIFYIDYLLYFYIIIFPSLCPHSLFIIVTLNSNVIGSNKCILHFFCCSYMYFPHIIFLFYHTRL